MNEDVQFLKKHKGKGALLDANLLLVYIVGLLSKRQLERFSRTKQYSGDYDLLLTVVEYFKRLYTTPNVLTEVSNLGKELGPSFFDILGSVVQRLDENYCDSKTAVSQKYFRIIGLTDGGLMEVGSQTLLITTDAQLHRFLRKEQIDAVNFNHLRFVSWTQ
jgi:hypothetical protein